MGMARWCCGQFNQNALVRSFCKPFIICAHQSWNMKRPTETSELLIYVNCLRWVTDTLLVGKLDLIFYLYQQPQLIILVPLKARKRIVQCNF